MTLGERIKKVRKSKDLTQQEFCEQIGLKRNSISLVESGKRNISDQAIKSICREYNVSETWLRTGDGEMFVQRSEEDELAAAVERLITGESAEFKRRLVNALSTLKDEHWLLLEQKLKEIVGMRDAVPASAHIPTIEEEARAEAEQHTQQIYQQILAEKKAAVGLLSESSEPRAGGGTVKQA